MADSVSQDSADAAAFLEQFARTLNLHFLSWENHEGVSF